MAVVAFSLSLRVMYVCVWGGGGEGGEEVACV